MSDNNNNKDNDNDDNGHVDILGFSIDNQLIEVTDSGTIKRDIIGTLRTKQGQKIVKEVFKDLEAYIDRQNK